MPSVVDNAASVAVSSVMNVMVPTAGAPVTGSSPRTSKVPPKLPPAENRAISSLAQVPGSSEKPWDEAWIRSAMVRTPLLASVSSRFCFRSRCMRDVDATTLTRPIIMIAIAIESSTSVKPSFADR